MSYKWGLNGNDLNWDYITGGGLKEVCPTCESNIRELRKEKGRALTDNEMDRIDCEGHEKKYSKRGWAIFHDTNGNHVYTTGNVPLDIYTSEYLTDMMKDYDIPEAKILRIWNVLKEREYYPTPFGVWSVSNNTSFNVYEYCGEAMLAGMSGLPPKWYEIETEDVNEENEDYANGEDTLEYIQRGETKWHLSQCMKV